MTMGEMASTVAHELNQPLTAITNYCNGMLSRVQAGTIAQDDLVDALSQDRAPGRACRADHPPHPRLREEERAAAPALGRARRWWRRRWSSRCIELRRRNVAIRTYVAQRLPTLMIDPILIEQVLLNLLKNAGRGHRHRRGCRPRGAMSSCAWCRAQCRAKASVIEFSVTDAGPGLKEEVQERLYEAFFSTKPEGLGIGLNLCRSIVESHQGGCGRRTSTMERLLPVALFLHAARSEPRRTASRRRLKPALPELPSTNQSVALS
jgi:signal transduction histidine kinase